MPLTISPPLTLPQFGGLLNYSWWWEVEGTCRAAIHNRVCLARLCSFVGWQHWTKEILHLCMEVMCTSTTQGLYLLRGFQQSWTLVSFFLLFSIQLQVLHEPLIDEDPVFIATCTERELRKRKKRKFSLWVRQCSSTGFICQVGFTSSGVLI